jgi:hypothetical protein
MKSKVIQKKENKDIKKPPDLRMVLVLLYTNSSMAIS